MNSNAFPGISSTGKFEQNGNKTECSLLELAYELGYNYKEYRPSDNVTIFALPFFSEEALILPLDLESYSFLIRKKKNDNSLQTNWQEYITHLL